ncbi:response regulator [bacterium]|nr:response regulator [bacterium]
MKNVEKTMTRQRILVVDDNRTNLNLVSATLEENYHIECVPYYVTTSPITSPITLTQESRRNDNF